MAAKSVNEKLTPEYQLKSFIDKWKPEEQKLIRSVRAALRKQFPTANELAYDYGRSIVISYSPTENGIDGIVAISLRDTGLSLFFNQGPTLPDPKKILKGSGKQTRYISIESARDLTQPDVKAMIAAAIEHALMPLATEGKGKLMIRGAAAKKVAVKKVAKKISKTR